MDAIQNNWLNAQATRRYPLDDNSTGTGDDGTRIKDDVIIDMHLRWPAIAGQYAFISGITVTQRIVTVMILAADSPTAVSGFTPLAAITVQQPAAEYGYYNLTPLYPGVGGFIAFGAVDEEFMIRFSTPQQGLLCAKVASPYVALPIPSMRKFGRADGLAGLVKILAGPNIEIVKDTVHCEGHDVDALVIRLQAPTSDNNPLSEYIGPCGKRPESKNCDRAGIQTINGITPDCNGNIEIEFQGLIANNYNNCGSLAAGVVIEQSLGLSDVCGPRTPTPFNGTDYCHPISESSISGGDNGGGGNSDHPSSESQSQSSEAIPCEDIPFKDFFNPTPHHSWALKLGGYQMISTSDIIYDHEGSSSFSEMVAMALQLDDTSRRNVFVWEDCGTGNSSNKIVKAQVKLTNNGPQQNGGVVLNYHIVNPFTNPQVKYFLAQINRNANRVELLSYNGASLVIENFVSVPIPFALTDWFEIKATVTDAAGGAILIQVNVRNITTPAWPAVSFQLLTNRWGQSDGFHGVHSNQAVANFSLWSIEDA